MKDQIDFNKRKDGYCAFFTCSKDLLNSFILYLNSKNIGMDGKEETFQSEGMTYFSILLDDDLSEEEAEKLISTFKG